MSGTWERGLDDLRGSEPPQPAGDSARRVSRRFEYLTIACMGVLIVVLCMISYRIHVSAKAEIEQKFNRQQLVLAKQAGDRISSFLDALSASLRYSAGFLRTIEPDHPGRMAVMAGLYERLGGRFRVSEVGYLTKKDEKSATPVPAQYLERLHECAGREGACLFVVRDEAKKVDFLFATAPVVPQGEEPAQGEAARSGDWLYARISMADLARSFVQPVDPGAKGSAWIADGQGRIILSPAVPTLENTEVSALARRLGDERLAEIVRRMGTENEGFDWHVGFGPEQGDTGLLYLTAFSSFRVGGERWTFAVTAPSSELGGLIRGLFRTDLLLTFFGLVAMSLTVALVLDRERRRIRAESRMHWSEQVLESSRRLEALFDGITDAIGILDKDFRVRMLNRSMARLFGRDISSVLNHKWEAAPERFVERGIVVDTFETGAPGFLEKSIKGDDGRVMEMEYYTYPILDSSGAASQVILYLKDVTARKELEREVLERDRLSIVGKMSAQVAHSIRNPLSAINLNAELLGDELAQFEGVDTAEAWALLRSVRAEVDVLGQVTADYLRFVRMPSSERTPVDCNEMIEDLLNFHAEVAVSRKIRVEMHLDDGVPEVMLDEAQMRLAIQNLILNGFDAMPEGGRLLVRTEAGAESLAIRISDTGTGISLEDQISLFTPFFTTKANGTGLGLVLSRQIVSEHQGSIRFESEEGRGATFIVELPLAVAQEVKA